MTQLKLVGSDLLKIKQALEDGRQIAGMRVLGRRDTYGVSTFTLMGHRWTIYASTEGKGAIGQERTQRVFGIRLIGDRERFEEDFILGKMTVT